MKIIIGADHAGFVLKNEIIKYLKEKDIECFDNNPEYIEADDYPDIALAVAMKVAKGEFDRGILICGSGIGEAIVANKVKDIRCGTCNDEYLAKMAKADNDINIIALGARVIDIEKAKKIIDIYFNTEFLGERHLRRVQKIKEIEKMIQEGN